MKIRLLAVATSLAITAIAASAQDTEAPGEPAGGSSVAVAPEQEQGAGVTAEKGKETISVDFPNAEIRTILRNIADLFELNLVIPETLEGRASLKLRNVTWKQIFEVLLQPVGYTYVEQNNIIKIVSIESQNIEPAVTEIFILNYARASDVAPTVQTMIDPAKGGRLQVDTRSNALVVTERPKPIEKIRVIIEKLDKATEQVMIETKFVEVTDRDIKNIGINWASLSGYSVGVGPITHTWTRERGQTYNQEYNADRSHEVNEGTVNLDDGTTTISGEPGTTTGSWTNNLTGETLMDVTTQTSTDVVKSTIQNLTELANTGGTSRVTSAVFSADEFQVVLSALKSTSETRLVSNPTVVTMNNNEALISIGEQYPIPSYTYNQEQGTFEVSGFEYKDIGIIMKVTPQVNNAGLITLKVDPEVSSRSGTTTFGGSGGASIPIIATRRTSTQVAIKDGYTMGLGGLIEMSNTDGGTKVPLLGDIPFIGKAFQSKSKDHQKRNLIVFITAKILSPEGATYRDIFPQAAMDNMGISEDDVPRAPGAAR